MVSPWQKTPCDQKKYQIVVLDRPPMAFVMLRPCAAVRSRWSSAVCRKHETRPARVNIHTKTSISAKMSTCSVRTTSSFSRYRTETTPPQWHLPRPLLVAMLPSARCMSATAPKGKKEEQQLPMKRSETPIPNVSLLKKGNEEDRKHFYIATN